MSSDAVVFHMPPRGSTGEDNGRLEAVRDALLSHGWREQPAGAAGCWNVMWSWSTRVAASATQLFAWQMINHFPRARHLTRKDLLSGHLQRHMAVHGCSSASAPAAPAAQAAQAWTGRRTSVFEIMPQTFALPKDYKRLCEVMTERQIDIGLERDHRRQAHPSRADDGDDDDPDDGERRRDNLWIMKPVGLSRGRGIFLVDDIATVSFSTPMICQKYISDPLLIRGFKFDLRLYVLVTSFSPLECWLSTLGFARFASRPYSRSASTIGDTLVHLTNTSVQAPGRGDSGGGPPEALADIIGEEGEGGTKASLSAAMGVIGGMRGAAEAEALWRRIRSIVLTSLFAVEDSVAHSRNCFELFGYDVLIDDAMRPWLIEANSSPQLDTPTALDARIKRRVVRDVAGVLQPPAFCRRELAGVLGERLGAAGRRGAGSCTKGITMAEERERIDGELRRIMRGTRPRKYGEMPRDAGGFERLAPGAEYDGLCRMKRRR